MTDLPLENSGFYIYNQRLNQIWSSLHIKFGKIDFNQDTEAIN